MDQDTAQALAAMAGAIRSMAGAITDLSGASKRQGDALEALVARTDSIERQLRAQGEAGRQLRERLRNTGADRGVVASRSATAANTP